jgi:CRISPR-associated protein Cas2
MLRLVVYDIANSRRLAKAARICEDYGVRVEYSVFECDLADEQFARFWGKLEKVIDVTKDRLIAYRICSACAERIQSIGAVVRLSKPLLYMA